MPKLKRKTYVGIDPGGQGGIVVFEGDEIRWLVMPATDPDLLKEISILPKDSKVVLEQVSAFVGSSASSAFTFGMGYGKLLLAVQSAKLAYTNPLPQQWMKTLGIVASKKKGKKKETGKAKKERLRKIAQQMFPQLSLWDESPTYQLKVCDALLIAEYARRTWK